MFISLLYSPYRCIWKPFRGSPTINQKPYISQNLAILIRYKNHFPNHPVKLLRMDNTLEFRSNAFEDYCTATYIILTYSTPYEHSQNGLAEFFIKKLQLVSRPPLIHANLPDSF